MGWRDRFWTASHWALDTSMHAVADTMSTCGTLVCTLGGVAFAVSNALALREVTASYYAAGTTAGDFNLGVKITNMNFCFNQSIPVSYGNQVNNGSTHELTDYVRSEAVRVAGAVCAVSGIALKVLGANLNKWQQSREERRDYIARGGIQIANPRLKEYLYVSAKVFSGSLTNTLISHSIAAAVLSFSGVLLPDITYPPFSNRHVNGSYYTGPIMSESFILKADLGENNFSISLPGGVDLDVLLKKAIDIAGNVTYGGGLFFKMNKAPLFIPLEAVESISVTVGASAYLASNFFANKAKKLHDERVREEDTKVYLPINSCL